MDKDIKQEVNVALINDLSYSYKVDINRANKIKLEMVNAIAVVTEELKRALEAGSIELPSDTVYVKIDYAVFIRITNFSTGLKVELINMYELDDLKPKNNE